MNNLLSFCKKYWGVLVALLLCFWAVKTLAVSGFFTVHDDEQIARLFELHKVVNDGQIPPRWVPDLGFGYGFPLFNFYPPFVYYLGNLFVSIGTSYIDGTKLVILSGFLLAALYMFLWSRKHFGVLPGLVASVLYTYASYHAVDVYVRGDIPEFFSFALIPAFFWAYDRAIEKKTLQHILLAGVFFGCIILTHSLVALMFAPFFLAYSLYYLIQSNNKFYVLRATCSMVLIGLGISAYFWLPSLLEKKYTLVDTILTRELASYKIHFVCLQQFWYSPWGYGGSVAGCNDGLSFQVGKVQLILVAISIACIIFLSIKRQLTKEIRFAGLLLLLFVFSLFMASDVSVFVWNSLQPLAYLQFPWRFLLFAAVFSSMLGGFVIEFIQKYFNNITASVISILIITLVIWRGSSYFNPQKHLFVSDTHYTTYQDIAWRVSNMSFEYVPKGVATKISPFGTTVLDIQQSEIAQSPYTLIQGHAAISTILNTSQKKVFMVISNENSLMQINTYSFPGWKVFIDDKEVSYSDKNKLKLITFSVPAGMHGITVKFNNTPPRVVGNIISVITFLIMVLIVMYYGFLQRKNTIQ